MRSIPSEGKRTRAATRKARRVERLVGPIITVEVTFRHMEASAALRLYAERKFAHVAKHLQRPAHIHLILAVDKYRQFGEATLKSGRLAVTAQEETKDLYSVIDLLTAKICGQLESRVGRSKSRRTRTLSTGEVMTQAEEHRAARR
ncbi:MAG TPA: ribosome-associated translation inhibitor RaiA [Candidatus Binataceae bacterium]|nr:ribosome-associated translation inhibitor RaiA [Candidatus Binataceae bacterium]